MQTRQSPLHMHIAYTLTKQMILLLLLPVRYPPMNNVLIMSLESDGIYRKHVLLSTI